MDSDLRSWNVQLNRQIFNRMMQKKVGRFLNISTIDQISLCGELLNLEIFQFVVLIY